MQKMILHVGIPKRYIATFKNKQNGAFRYIEKVGYNLEKEIYMTIELSEEMQGQLASIGITKYDEVALRQTLEQHTTTYTLIKLAEWPARRWKCHYRLMAAR
jgi:hypothetical protein